MLMFYVFFFFETSSKDNINVSESFKELINKIYELHKNEF